MQQEMNSTLAQTKPAAHHDVVQQLIAKVEGIQVAAHNNHEHLLHMLVALERFIQENNAQQIPATPEFIGGAALLNNVQTILRAMQPPAKALVENLTWGTQPGRHTTPKQ